MCVSTASCSRIHAAAAIFVFEKAYLVGTAMGVLVTANIVGTVMGVLMAADLVGHSNGVSVALIGVHWSISLLCALCNVQNPNISL